MTQNDRIDTALQRYEEPDMAPGQVDAATAWMLVGLSLLLVLSVSLWRWTGASDAKLTPNAGTASSTVAADFDRVRTADGLREANRQMLSLLDGFETRLEESSPVRGATLEAMQWLLLRHGGIGNETVYAGSDGWLLLRTGYDHLVGTLFLDPNVLERRRRSVDSWRPEVSPDPRPALLDFHRQLQARGIDLVVLPIPTKPAIQAESLESGAPRPVANASMRQLVDELKGAGIEVFDLVTILHRLAETGTDAYLRTDSHWSPAAVDAVADALAAWLEQTYGAERAGLGPADEFWQATPTQREGRGDLWRLLRLPASRPIYDQETVTGQEVTSWDGRLWSPAADSAVLVLGDSFVNVYSDAALHWGRGAGFAEQLSLHLERGVDRMARNDGASDQVRRDLARSPNRLETKRVVVYLFAARELSVGDWPLVRLGR